MNAADRLAEVLRKALPFVGGWHASNTNEIAEAGRAALAAYDAERQAAPDLAALVAAAIHRSVMVQGIGRRNAREVQGAQRALRLAAGDIAATLAVNIPGFDRAEFLKACGVSA